MNRSSKGSDPRCWWCHKQIDAGTKYRGTAPELQLPTGSGVIICGPLCKARPSDRTVYLHP